MIIYHKNHVAAFTGAHIWYWPLNPLVKQHDRIAISPAAAAGRIMSSLAGSGGLAYKGGIAGIGGGLAG